MPISRASLVRLSLLLSLVLQFTTSVAPAAEAALVTVVTSEAAPDFPATITFELTATVEGEVDFVDLVYQPAALETYQLLPAEFEVSGDRVRANASADLATYFLPVGIDLTYHWNLTMTDGEVVATEANVVTWIDDRFDWDMTSFPGVELYSYGRSSDFLELTAEVCEQASLELTSLYGLSRVVPIKIWIYGSGEDFAGTLAANSGEWAAGLAYPDLQVIGAVIPDDSRSEVERVLPHEISHQLLYQATLNPYSITATWIDEGLAVVAQTGGKERYRDVVVDAYNDGELLALRGLISSFPFDPEGARKAYAQSFLVTEFLLATFGTEVISAIIEGYQRGLSHDDVLIRAIGLDTNELEAAWLDSLASASPELAA